MLKDVNEITNWLLLNSNLELNDFRVVNINDNYVVDSFKSVIIFYDEKKDIPIKFNEIDGMLKVRYMTTINKNKLFNLDFLPKIINGDLTIINAPLTQDSFNNWETTTIKGRINFCGKESSIENLKFLENTNFEAFYLKVADTPFKDNIIPEIYKNTKSWSLITKEELDLILITTNDILDYFNFNNEISLDKDK